MAQIKVNVQSLIRFGRTIEVFPDSADTVAVLKDLVIAAENIPESIVELFFGGVRLQDNQTLDDIGIVDNSFVDSANNIATFEPKNKRRDLKLFLSSAERQQSSTNEFREYNVYVPPDRPSGGEGSEGHPWEIPGEELTAPASVSLAYTPPSTVTVGWDDLNPTEDGFRVFRSLVENDLADTENMPSSIAELPVDTVQYIDSNTPTGNIVHYRVSVFRGLQTLFSTTRTVDAGVGGLTTRSGDLVVTRETELTVNNR